MGTNLKWVTGINRTVREILQPKLAGMNVDVVAENLMCDNVKAKAIMDGTIDMTISHLVILCKLSGFEPHDVVKVAVQHNVQTNHAKLKTNVAKADGADG